MTTSGAGQDAQVGRQAELQRVLADQPVAERVERRDRGVGVSVRDELVDADRHLVGGLVGERQGEDLRRLGPMRGDEPGDPPGDDLGLAGPRPGDHEERSVAVRDRAQLVRVQPAQQGLEPCRGLARDRGIHHRHELAPGRQLVERVRFAPPPGPRAHQVVGPGRCGRRARRRESRVGGGHVRSIAGRRDS